MSEGLAALLGCVQSEVSQLDPSGKPRVYENCLTERVVLPTPLDGAHIVAVTCKHCQQAVRVQVRSRGQVRIKRLISRLALAASVCLWAAGAALALVYFLEQYPAAPGREFLLAGILVLLGAVLWGAVDTQTAFAGDVAARCTIERAPEEKAWSKQVSRGVMAALPRHVLLEPLYGAASAGLRGEVARTPTATRRKPSVSSTAVTSGRASRSA